MQQDLIKISKFLSLVLRHKPEEINLTLDKNGWADVDELLKKANFDVDTLIEVVDTNDKKRFSFNEDMTKIRANQGHSINIDLQLEACQPLECLYHGTATRFIDSIKQQGLVKGKRQFVHLSATPEIATKVGSRHGVPVVLKIESMKMYNDGFKFYLSNNGVWLTNNVPINYIIFV